MALVNTAPAVSKTGKIQGNTDPHSAVRKKNGEKSFASMVEAAGAEKSGKSQNKETAGTTGKNSVEKSVKKVSFSEITGSDKTKALLRKIAENNARQGKHQKLNTEDTETLKTQGKKGVSPKSVKKEKTSAADSAQKHAQMQQAAAALLENSAQLKAGSPERPTSKTQKTGKIKQTESGRPAVRSAGESSLTSKAGRVHVVDNRSFAERAASINTGKNPEGSLNRGKSAPGSAAESGIASASKNKAADRRRAALKNQSEVQKTPETQTGTSDFKLPLVETDIELTPSGNKGFLKASAAQELARKLDAQAGNELVQQVKVVLNRADAGEIRINLRPDNLGNVRVKIQLADNQISGRIVVDSAAAHEAFKSAISGLQDRLVESGFGSADLELAWNSGSSEGSSAGGEKRNRQGSGKASQVMPELENRISSVFVDETDNGRVNMVV